MSVVGTDRDSRLWQVNWVYSMTINKECSVGVMTARVKAGMGVMVLASVGLLAGCNDLYTKDGSCVTCFKDPFGIVSVSSGTTTDSSGPRSIGLGAPNNAPYSEGRHVVSMAVNQDVDLVFIRMKREFGFQSPEELRAARGDLASRMRMQDAGWRYEATPGVTYHMRSDATVSGQDIVLDMVIDKLGSGKAALTMTYRNPAGANVSQLESALKARVKKALG
ncbi:hypothetical protein WH50_15225 [Pokkaliibacter plantistimulans]|uniref:Lipoprotein n=2 Tax=Pokkaliibacter plantistimulans TaxID=1635171 RepID=A0ABX5M0G8_9GAMM|nr:hypothetical protein WH50_15225 [Pokkaliibacter plantistimulans]